MNPYKSFEMLHAINEQSYYVKALYYAFGWNKFVDMLPGVPAQMKVDAIEFAKLYSEQFNDAEHVISIDDCFTMYVAGKRVFKRA